MTSVLHITWIDSEVSTGWEDDQTIDEEMGLAHSVGFLIKETKDAIVLAHSVDPGTGEFNGRIHIPIVAIKELKEICQIQTTI